MAESQTERGVNEISKGEKNLDSEFKKSSGKAVPRRATSRKSGSKSKKAKAKKKKKANRKRK